MFSTQVSDNCENSLTSTRNTLDSVSRTIAASCTHHGSCINTWLSLNDRFGIIIDSNAFQGHRTEMRLNSRRLLLQPKTSCISEVDKRPATLSVPPRRHVGLFEVICMLLKSLSTTVTLGLPIFLAVQLTAQVPAPTVPDNGPTPASPLGIAPHASSSGTSENINMMNGSLNVYLPLLSIPQRGGSSLNLGLVHKSNSYTLAQHTSVSSTPDPSQGRGVVIDTIQYTDSMQDYDEPLAINLPRLQFSYEYVGDHDFTDGSGDIDSVGDVYCATNFQFTDWAGNKHPFENVSTCNWHLGGPNLSPIDVTDSSDGSFYRLDTTSQTDIKVYSKNGTVYHFYGFSNLFPDNGTAVDSWSNQENYYDSRTGLIVDPNGNQITITTTYGSNGPSYKVLDTLNTPNREIDISPTGLSSYNVSYKDSNGNPQTIQISTTASQSTTPYTFGLNCNYEGPTQMSPYVTPTVSTISTYSGFPVSSTTQVTFPSGQGGGQKQYTFTFDYINRLTEIQYPFGGSTSYTYREYSPSVLMGNVQCTNPMEEVVQKTECTSSSGTSCNTTTYAPTFTPGLTTPYNATMTVTDPLGNKEVHTFSTTNPTRTNPQESDVRTYNLAGVLMRSVHNSFPTITNSGGYVTFDYDFPNQVTTTLNDGSPAVSSVVNYSYESYAAVPGYMSGIIDNPTEIDTTDYTGTVISKVSSQWEPMGFFSASGGHILDRLASKTVADQVKGLQNTTTYVYDNGADTVGNLTKETVTATNAPTAVTQFVVNGYGEVTQITDPDQHVTLVYYNDAWADSWCSIASGSSAYPSSITNAAGETTSYTYNTCTGTIASVSGPNTNQTTTYTYDSLQRVVSASFPDTGGKKACYFDSAPSAITTYTLQATGSSLPACTSPTAAPPGMVTSSVILDGFGRKSQTQLLSDPYGSILIDTAYDPNGNIQSVSNPYRSTTDPTYGTTEYEYDALQRKIMMTNPDHSTEQWSYSGNVTTFTNENGSKWQRTSNVLGKLISILEPNGSSTSPSMETDYTYDGFGNLWSVTQWGGANGSSGARIRSFTYSGLSQLLTASNPESGTVCYGTKSGSSCTPGYDAAGNLLSRTDARGITTTYSYDNINRLLQKSYNDGNPPATPTACYQYSSSSVPYGIGELTNEWTQSSSTCSSSGSFFTKRSILAYDSMERVKSEQQFTPASQASGYQYAPAYTFDLAGELLTATNGITTTPVVGTLIFANAFDGAGRLKTVSSNWIDSSHPSPLFAAQTLPSQALQCQQAASSPYTPFGQLSNAVYGNGIALSRTYDTRQRLTCEIDSANSIP